MVRTELPFPFVPLLGPGEGSGLGYGHRGSFARLDCPEFDGDNPPGGPFAVRHTFMFVLSILQFGSALLWFTSLEQWLCGWNGLRRM